MIENKFPKDPVMQTLYERVIAATSIIDIVPVSKESYFADLCESIIGQQLSNKVADVIVERVKEILGGKFTPESILSVSLEELRKASLSNAKANYIKNLSQHWINGDIDYKNFNKIGDEEIIRELVQVKGIGRWMAEMFLMFSLGRPDVYSYGDLILRTGVMNLYKLKKADQKRIERITNKWSPYKTLGSRVLWKAKELKLL